MRTAQHLAMGRTTHPGEFLETSRSGPISTQVIALWMGANGEEGPAEPPKIWLWDAAWCRVSRMVSRHKTVEHRARAPPDAGETLILDTSSVSTTDAVASQPGNGH